MQNKSYQTTPLFEEYPVDKDLTGVTDFSAPLLTTHEEDPTLSTIAIVDTVNGIGKRSLNDALGIIEKLRESLEMNIMYIQAEKIDECFTPEHLNLITSINAAIYNEVKGIVNLIRGEVTTYVSAALAYVAAGTYKPTMNIPVWDDMHNITSGILAEIAGASIVIDKSNLSGSYVYEQGKIHLGTRVQRSIKQPSYPYFESKNGPAAELIAGTVNINEEEAYTQSLKNYKRPELKDFSVGNILVHEKQQSEDMNRQMIVGSNADAIILPLNSHKVPSVYFRAFIDNEFSEKQIPTFIISKTSVSENNSYPRRGVEGNSIHVGDMTIEALLMKLSYFSEDFKKIEIVFRKRGVENTVLENYFGEISKKRRREPNPPRRFFS